MRDKLKNKEYFKEQLEGIYIDIEIDMDSDGYAPNWFGLYISYFAKLITKYSIGENIENLNNEDFINLVDAFKRFYTEDTSYNKILNTLSLSIIFNKDITKELTNIYRNKRILRWLYISIFYKFW